MTDQLTCVICNCTFRAREDGIEKCNSCLRKYPHVKSRKELLADEDGSQVYLTKAEIIKVVQDVIMKMAATKKCEKCRQPFIPKSPAQKTCHQCRELETAVEGDSE